MKVTIRRTGGFAGLQQDLASIDTRQLAPDLARTLSTHRQELTTLLDAEEPEVGADFVKYELELSGEPGQPQQKLTVLDTGDPADPKMGHVRAILELAGAAV